MVFDLGRLAAALLTGGRGGRSAEARIVRAVTKAVAGAAGRSARAGGAEATRRKKEAEAWGIPAPPPARPRRRGTDRAIAAGTAVLAETIAEAMARSSAPSPLPPTIPAPREAGRHAPAAPPPAPAPAPVRRAGSVPATTPPAGGRPPSSPPSPASAVPASEGLLLVRAMVAAAKADGRLDAAERKAILERLEIAGLSAAERDVVLADFDRPATPEALAKDVKDPLLAARIYAAAAAAAGERCAAEREFLAALARALRLDAPAVEAIERQLGG